MSKDTDQFGVNAISDQGSAVQVFKAANAPDVALTLTPVPNGGNVQSLAVRSCGFKSGAVSLQSTQPGAINVQRYLDEAGTIPVGAVITAALVAATQNWVTWNDGVAFGSFKITVTNTGVAPGTISIFGLLLQST